MFDKVQVRLHGQTPQHQLSELVRVSPRREAKLQIASKHLVATRKQKVLQNIILIFFATPETSEGRTIKSSLMAEISQFMQHFTGNLTSRWLLAAPARDAVFQPCFFELQLVPSILDRTPNLSRSHLARRCRRTLFPASLLPGVCLAASPRALLAGHSQLRCPNSWATG